MSTATQPILATPVKAATGDFVWHELRTTDAKGALEFYTHVVGWQATPSGDPGGIPYTLLSIGGYSTAGLMQLTPDMLAAGMQPCWAGFIGVDDVDAYAKRLEQAGGKLHCPPQDIPTVGRWASVEDIDAAETRVKEKNGQVLMGPHEVPGGSWIILGLDPQGAMFALVGPRKK